MERKGNGKGKEKGAEREKRRKAIYTDKLNDAEYLYLKTMTC